MKKDWPAHIVSTGIHFIKLGEYGVHINLELIDREPGRYITIDLTPLAASKLGISLMKAAQQAERYSN